MKLRWISSFSALFIIIGITILSIGLVVVPAGDVNRWVVAAIRVPPDSTWLWHDGMTQPTKVTLGMAVHTGDTIITTGSYLQTDNTLQPALLLLKSANGNYIDVSCANSGLVLTADDAPWWTERLFRTFFAQQDVDSNVLLDEYGRRLITAASRGGAGNGVFSGLCARPLPDKNTLKPQQFIPEVPFYVQIDLTAENLPAQLQVHYADESTSEPIILQDTGPLIVPSSLMRIDAKSLHINNINSSTELDRLNLEPIVLTSNDSTVELEKSTANE